MGICRPPTRKPQHVLLPEAQRDSQSRRDREGKWQAVGGGSGFGRGASRGSTGLTSARLPPQDQKIYIYSLKGMCPLNTPQRALDTPAVVTCLLAVPVIKKVRSEGSWMPRGLTLPSSSVGVPPPIQKV